MCHGKLNSFSSLIFVPKKVKVVRQFVKSKHILCMELPVTFRAISYVSVMEPSRVTRQNEAAHQNRILCPCSCICRIYWKKKNETCRDMKFDRNQEIDFIVMSHSYATPN